MQPIEQVGSNKGSLNTAAHCPPPVHTGTYKEHTVHTSILGTYRVDTRYIQDTYKLLQSTYKVHTSIQGPYKVHTRYIQGTYKPTRYIRYIRAYMDTQHAYKVHTRYTRAYTYMVQYLQSTYSAVHIGAHYHFMT